MENLKKAAAEASSFFVRAKQVNIFSAKFCVLVKIIHLRLK